MLAADAIDKRAIKGLAASLESLGTDIATIGSKAGYRATLTTLSKADSVKEVSVMAKLSTRFGKATRGALVLAGGALTFASVTASAAFWSISLLLWAGGGAARASRGCAGASAAGWRRSPRPQPA